MLSNKSFKEKKQLDVSIGIARIYDWWGPGVSIADANAV